MAKAKKKSTKGKKAKVLFGKLKKYSMDRLVKKSVSKRNSLVAFAYTSHYDNSWDVGGSFVHTHRHWDGNPGGGPC